MKHAEWWTYIRVYLFHEITSDLLQENTVECLQRNKPVVRLFSVMWSLFFKAMYSVFNFSECTPPLSFLISSHPWTAIFMPTLLSSVFFCSVIIFCYQLIQKDGFRKQQPIQPDVGALTSSTEHRSSGRAPSLHRCVTWTLRVRERWMRCGATAAGTGGCGGRSLLLSLFKTQLASHIDLQESTQWCSNDRVTDHYWPTCDRCIHTPLTARRLRPVIQ